MKLKRTRIWAVVLALALVLTALTATAMAAAPVAVNVESAAALQEAIGAASENSVIVIQNDIELDDVVTVNKAVTIKSGENVTVSVSENFPTNKNGQAVFCLNAPGATLDNLKVDLSAHKYGTLNVAYMTNGTKVTNCVFIGAGATSNPVTRGVHVISGAKNIEISNNQFSNFFSSGYVNPVSASDAEINITGNTATNTLADWTIVWSNSNGVTISGNTGDNGMYFTNNGTEENAFDLTAISKANPGTKYVCYRDTGDGALAVLKDGEFVVDDTPWFSVEGEANVATKLQDAFLAVTDNATIVVEPGEYDITTEYPIPGTNNRIGSTLVLNADNVTIKAADPDDKPVIYGFSNSPDGRRDYANGQSTITINGENAKLENLVILPLSGYGTSNTNQYQKGLEVTRSATGFDMTGCEFLPNTKNAPDGAANNMPDKAGLVYFETDVEVAGNVFGTGATVCAGWRGTTAEEGYCSVDASNNYWGEDATPASIANMINGPISIDQYYADKEMTEPVAMGGTPVATNAQLEAALAAASDGDTITIAGEITGTVKIEKNVKNLTIQGSETGVIKNGKLTIASNGIQLPGLTIQNLTFQNANIEMFPNAHSDVSNMTIVGNTFTGPVSASYSAIHMNFGSKSGTDHGASWDGLVISHNNIKDITSNNSSGILIIGDDATKSYLKISNNTIDGVAWNGIQLNRVKGNEIYVIDNEISNCGANGQDGLVNLFETTADIFQIRGNKFYPKDNQLVLSNVADDVDASYNYWGSKFPNFEKLIGYWADTKVDVETDPYYMADTMRKQDLNTFVNGVIGGIIGGAGEGDTFFTDVKGSDWYYDAVKFVFDNGFMDGVGDGKFNPNGTLTRAMIAQVLYNLEDETSSYPTVFDDVAKSAWYADAVNWAAASGIVEGKGNNKFDPNAAITRQEMAAILYRYSELKGYDVSDVDSLAAFTDAASVASWAKEAMGWAVENYVINGKGNGKLDPTGTATRAEVAQILMNLCNNVL